MADGGLKGRDTALFFETVGREATIPVVWTEEMEEKSLIDRVSITRI